MIIKEHFSLHAQTTEFLFFFFFIIPILEAASIENAVWLFL